VRGFLIVSGMEPASPTGAWAILRSVTHGLGVDPGPTLPRGRGRHGYRGALSKCSGANSSATLCWSAKLPWPPPSQQRSPWFSNTRLADSPTMEPRPTTAGLFVSRAATALCSGAFHPGADPELLSASPTVLSRIGLRVWTNSELAPASAGAVSPGRLVFNVIGASNVVALRDPRQRRLYAERIRNVAD
jgi:hypothetical protein